MLVVSSEDVCSAECWPSTVQSRSAYKGVCVCVCVCVCTHTHACLIYMCVYHSASMCPACVFFYVAYIVDICV